MPVESACSPVNPKALDSKPAAARPRRGLKVLRQLLACGVRLLTNAAQPIGERVRPVREPLLPDPRKSGATGAGRGEEIRIGTIRKDLGVANLRSSE